MVRGRPGRQQRRRAHARLPRGGREHLRVQIADGPECDFDAVFQDIVDGERIIWSYDMHINGRRIYDAGARLFEHEHPAEGVHRGVRSDE